MHLYGVHCIGFRDGICQGYLHFGLLGKEWQLAITGVSWRRNLVFKVLYSVFVHLGYRIVSLYPD
jgi:hypothetical protein